MGPKHECKRAPSQLYCPSSRSFAPSLRPASNDLLGRRRTLHTAIADRAVSISAPKNILLRSGRAGHTAAAIAGFHPPAAERGSHPATISPRRIDSPAATEPPRDGSAGPSALYNFFRRCAAPESNLRPILSKPAFRRSRAGKYLNAVAGGLPISSSKPETRPPNRDSRRPAESLPAVLRLGDRAGARRHTIDVESAPEGRTTFIVTLRMEDS